MFVVPIAMNSKRDATARVVRVTVPDVEFTLNPSGDQPTAFGWRTSSTHSIDQFSLAGCAKRPSGYIASSHLVVSSRVSAAITTAMIISVNSVGLGNFRREMRGVEIAYRP